MLTQHAYQESQQVSKMVIQHTETAVQKASFEILELTEMNQHIPIKDFYSCQMCPFEVYFKKQPLLETNESFRIRSEEYRS